MQKSAPPQDFDWSAYALTKPDDFARNMLRLMEEGGKALSGLIDRADTGNGPYSPSSEIAEMTKVLGEVAQKWLQDPAKAAGAQTDLMRSYMDVWNATVRTLMGEDVKPVAVPEAGDARFRDDTVDAHGTDALGIEEARRGIEQAAARGACSVIGLRN